MYTSNTTIGHETLQMLNARLRAKNESRHGSWVTGHGSNGSSKLDGPCEITCSMDPEVLDPILQYSHTTKGELFVKVMNVSHWFTSKSRNHSREVFCMNRRLTVASKASSVARSLELSNVDLG